MKDSDNPDQKTTSSRQKNKEGLFLSAEGIFHNGLYNIPHNSSKTLNDNKASMKETLKKPTVQALIFILIVGTMALILMSIL